VKNVSMKNPAGPRKKLADVDSQTHVNLYYLLNIFPWKRSG